MKRISLFFLAVIIQGGLTLAQVTSYFETDTDGWHSEGDGAYLWEASTGNPGGCFRVNDDATGDWNNAVAPVEYLGDWSNATAADFVSADVFVHQIGGSYSENTYVFRIKGPGGEATALNSIHPPVEVWNTYTVYLDPANWTILSGTWSGILEQVNDFIVRAEYIYGDEYDRLDNITLSITPEVIQVTPGICSDFEDGGFDSWTFAYTAGTTNQADAGNPGNCIKITDGTGVSVAYPSPKFLGDWTLLDSHAADIRVDIKITNFTAGIYISSYLIKISGPGGEAFIPMDNSVLEASNRWKTFVFPIEQSYWTMSSGSWVDLLAHVNSMELIVEYINGTEIVWMDNFCIADTPPVADFYTEKQIEFAGNPISFYDLSVNGPVDWDWEFGDGGTSTDQHPVHTYLTEGLFDIGLTASNYFGSGNTVKENYIEVLPIDECLKYEDNFDDGVINPLMTTKNGTWVESGGRIGQTSNYYVSGNLLGGCYAMTGSLLWEDYIVTCDMMSTDNDHIGFVFNWQDELNTYMFYWNAEGSYRRISKWINGTETIIASQSIPYVLNTWYNVKITSVPGNIKLSIDGVPIFDIIDNTFTHGKVALFCSGNQSSYWDNFRVGCTGLELNLKALLEGPFNGLAMNTDLTNLLDFPLIQPYNISPWNYSGTESVIAVPSGAVDWVLVELRDATSATAATASTMIARQAAFLMEDGSIRSLDGTSLQQFNISTIQHFLFAVIYHRNHLGILSSNPVSFSGGIYSYDFTTSASQAYGSNAQKNLGGGIYGMYAGDFNADGTINVNDKENPWETGSGTYGYLNSDGDFDGQTDNNDKNDFWLINKDKSSQVPD